MSFNIDVLVYEWDGDFIFYPVTDESCAWLWDAAALKQQVWIGPGLLVEKDSLERLLTFLNQTKLKVRRRTLPASGACCECTQSAQHLHDLRHRQIRGGSPLLRWSGWRVLLNLVLREEGQACG